MNKYLHVFIVVLSSLMAFLVSGPFLIPVPPLKDVLVLEMLTHPDSHNLEVKGNKVHYKITGRSDPVFLLLIGFASSLFTWHESMPELAKNGTVIAYERQSFGLTKRPRTWKGENQFGVQAQVDVAVEQASDSPTPTLQGTPGAGIPTTAITYVVPVRKATPNADGSIVHVVEYGQTLYAIADAYEVTIDQIQTLNKLTSTTIYVGDKLIIQATFTPTAIGQPTLTVPARTPSKNFTITPRPPTATPSPTNPTTVMPTPTPTPIPTVLSGIGKDPLLLLIIIIASAGLFMMVAGSLLRRKN
jgi:LysM repeat protein